MDARARGLTLQSVGGMLLMAISFTLTESSLLPATRLRTAAGLIAASLFTFFTHAGMRMRIIIVVKRTNRGIRRLIVFHI